MCSASQINLFTCPYAPAEFYNIITHSNSEQVNLVSKYSMQFLILFWWGLHFNNYNNLYESLRKAHVCISLRIFELLGIHWNLAGQLFSLARCFVSTSGQTRLQIRFWKSIHTPPPPPPPSKYSVKYTRTVFWLSRIEILYCLDTDRERVGGIFAQYYA